MLNNLSMGNMANRLINDGYKCVFIPGIPDPNGKLENSFACEWHSKLNMSNCPGFMQNYVNYCALYGGKFPSIKCF